MKERFKQRHFNHTFPRFGRTKQQKDAKSYEYNSVYWFWYQFLKKSENYKKVCKSKGKSGSTKLKKLYKDFGDIHSMDFKSWWTEVTDKTKPYMRGAYLFSEKTDYNLREIESRDDLTIDESILNLQIPLSMSKREISKLFHIIIKDKHKGSVGRRSSEHEYSTAIYKIKGRVELTALKKCLMVYEEYEKNNEYKKKQSTKHKVKKLWEIGNNKEIVGKQHRLKEGGDIDFSDKRDYLSKLVHKLYKRSEILIKNAEGMTFPS